MPDMTVAALDGRGGRAYVGRSGAGDAAGDGNAETTDAPPAGSGSFNCCCNDGAAPRAAAALRGRGAAAPRAPPEATDAAPDHPALLVLFPLPAAAAVEQKKGARNAVGR